MRSLNNVVDITNYVLMEFGHPLHAFDYHLLDGGEIIVRRAGDNELFHTLDGQERILSSNDLTIRDRTKAIALAGIMGGENSEIKESTTDILIESASFDPTAIRRTSKRLGMHTESSHRFERGADIHMLTRALDRAASLVAELAGGKVARGIIDAYPKRVEPRTIEVRQERVCQLLGCRLSSDEIAKIFKDLEFVVEEGEPGCLRVTVPTFRVDIEREVDLIEEVARMNGYEKIPATMPKVRIFSDRPSRHLRLEKRLRDIFVTHGLVEVVTYSFINPNSLDRILLADSDQRRNSIRVLNPLTEDQAVMRTTLLPGLLDTAARNASFRLQDLKIFELRRVYLPAEGSELPNEPVFAAGVLSGMREPEGWNRSRETVDFYDVKGLVENILDDFSIAGASFKARDIENYYHPGKSCSIFIDNERLGSFGEIHPDVQDNYDIDNPLYFFEIDFEKLVKFSCEVESVSPPPRYPDTYRDIALLVNEETETGDVLDCIKSSKIKEMDSVELFDLYVGPNIPSGHRSIAIRIRYRSHERTLTDDEVNNMHQRVMDNLLKKINVSIR
jgi:phenylalanyl-tRNA synthetase beta chain